VKHKTRKFPKQFLQDMLYGCDVGAEVLEDTVYDTRRWSIDHELIFKFDGKFYVSCYSVGATEYQDESPWEYEPDEVECTEVQPVSVVTTEYQPVGDYENEPDNL
jgi:hypothetical protein